VHRVILFAAHRSLQWATADALFRAYFTEGGDLNGREQVSGFCVRRGARRSGVRGYLEDGDGADEILANQEAAGRLGKVGVPFYVFDGR
jgi:predicted DsbA family dithiol-disulfide isomerase